MLVLMLMLGLLLLVLVLVLMVVLVRRVRLVRRSLLPLLWAVLFYLISAALDMLVLMLLLALLVLVVLMLMMLLVLVLVGIFEVPGPLLEVAFLTVLEIAPWLIWIAITIAINRAVFSRFKLICAPLGKLLREALGLGLRLGELKDGAAKLRSRCRWGGALGFLSDRTHYVS